MLYYMGVQKLLKVILAVWVEVLKNMFYSHIEIVEVILRLYT